MKAEELMVGDWVYIRDCETIERVESITPPRIGTDHSDDLLQGDNIAPIDITPEILEKNGIHFNEEFRSKNDKPQWVCTKKEGYFFLEKRGKEWNLIITCYEGGFYSKKNFNGEISCVHELQHALRLCNIEKEIEL